jgi:hypothetical protein
LAGPWTVRRNRKRGRRRIVSRPPGGPAAQSRDIRGESSAPDPDTDPWQAVITQDGAVLEPTATVALAGTVTATRTADVDLDVTDPADIAVDDETGAYAPSEAGDLVGSGTSGAEANGAGQGATSYLNLVWHPSFTTPPRPRVGPGIGRSRRALRRRRRISVGVLALLGVAGLVLTAVIVGLANLGLTSAAGSSDASSLLAVPAPYMAGGLPRHYQPVQDYQTAELIAQFTQRFASATGGHTGRPAALYREPGTVDLATNQPGWVLYLGYNSPADLGRPTATIGRVITTLIDSSAPDSYWVAAPGARGGSARCAITTFGTTTVSLCAWATAHTIGALFSPTADTRGNELAVLMPQMRLELQPG